MENEKRNAITRACLKIVAEAKKKAKEKLGQAKYKAKSKKQGLETRKLAIANCQVEFGTFKALLSDSSTSNDLLPSTFSHTAPPTTSLLPVFAAEKAQAARLEKIKALVTVSAQKLDYLPRK